MIRKKPPAQLYKPKATCMTCEQEKPCSWHALRNGMVCGDCWSYKDLPPHLRLKVANKQTQSQIDDEKKAARDRLRSQRISALRNAEKDRQRSASHRLKKGEIPAPHPDCY